MRWRLAPPCAAAASLHLFHALQCLDDLRTPRHRLVPLLAFGLDHFFRRARDEIRVCELGVDAVDLGLGLDQPRSEEHTSELQSLTNLVCRLLLEKKNNAYLTHSAIDSFLH